MYLFALVLILSQPILLAGPALAAPASEIGKCAALWYGVVDAGKKVPGYLRETQNAAALARSFEKMAGAEGKGAISALRRDMELLARAYVIGDPESVMLFDRLAVRCKDIAAEAKATN